MTLYNTRRPRYSQDPNERPLICKAFVGKTIKSMQIKGKPTAQNPAADTTCFSFTFTDGTSCKIYTHDKQSCIVKVEQ